MNNSSMEDPPLWGPLEIEGRPVDGTTFESMGVGNVDLPSGRRMMEQQRLTVTAPGRKNDARNGSDSR